MKTNTENYTWQKQQTLLHFKTFRLHLKQSIKIIVIKMTLTFLQFHFKVKMVREKGLRETDLNSKGSSCDPVVEASGLRHRWQQDEADTQQRCWQLTGPAGLKNCWSWSIRADLDGGEEVKGQSQTSWAELFRQQPSDRLGGEEVHLVQHSEGLSPAVWSVFAGESGAREWG